MKKPCKGCPYVKGNLGNFDELVTESYQYDGTPVHDCHTITDYYTKEVPNSECIGSALFGQKMKGFIVDKRIKDLIEMERT